MRFFSVWNKIYTVFYFPSYLSYSKRYWNNLNFLINLQESSMPMTTASALVTLIKWTPTGTALATLVTTAFKYLTLFKMTPMKTLLGMNVTPILTLTGESLCHWKVLLIILLNTVFSSYACGGSSHTKFDPPIGRLKKLYKHAMDI